MVKDRVPGAYSVIWNRVQQFGDNNTRVPVLSCIMHDIAGDRKVEGGIVVAIEITAQEHLLTPYMLRRLDLVFPHF